jgi:hypothetical protein
MEGVQGVQEVAGVRGNPDLNQNIQRRSFALEVSFNAARQEAATRRGSNRARSSGIRMAHQQRAEIFALPLNALAIGATICSIFNRHGHLYL